MKTSEEELRLTMAIPLQRLRNFILRIIFLSHMNHTRFKRISCVSCILYSNAEDWVYLRALQERYAIDYIYQHLLNGYLSLSWSDLNFFIVCLYLSSLFRLSNCPISCTPLFVHLVALYLEQRCTVQKLISLPIKCDFWILISCLVAQNRPHLIGQITVHYLWYISMVARPWRARGKCTFVTYFYNQYNRWR